MECDREVLFCSGVPHCKCRLLCALRGPIADNPWRAVPPGACVDSFPSVPPLGFLSGSNVPWHSADGTRPAVGPAVGDSCQQFSLHLRSVTLLPSLAHLASSPHVRGHFRHRLVLCGVVHEVGQFVDGCHLSWHRQLIYRGHAAALMADGIGCRLKTRNRTVGISAKMSCPVSRLELSRWRGGRFACYAPHVMPQRKVSNCGSRTCSFSKYRKTNSLQMGEN